MEGLCETPKIFPKLILTTSRERSQDFVVERRLEIRVRHDLVPGANNVVSKLVEANQVLAKQ